MARKKNEGFREEPQAFDHDADTSKAPFSWAVTATIGDGGRLVIPAEMRKLMDVKPGDTVALRMVDGYLQVASQSATLKKIWESAEKLKRPGVSLVDEFIADRLAEQRASDARFDRLAREAAEIGKAQKK
ncbi:AbrB/MazE/SpoVT family DNA-binding domain-containing protein [Phyllobacterium myrsinacearum]|jgi:AbrB family looped-hinge helix DNA binding protein|uniref:AbrB/MazE/SpoVT family DNA-binding domain-containing protein n=2 Tax=Phyllobacterium myrsinacearum TaxID=28101 RepID=A0A2S9JE30_9HYPH|nr:AbrB/MazE/SpoVT family DNA-binding domain-containing protein [Phyllobacterium myrsinacearum]PRD51119.1 AbrB/MazE/SpoVT family DNA-binding domain-containing protein [Phyllobacterium myrsinacearum]PWV86680.1 AbrB family looped-hinge helix DNA binding protein [Phyllobacterium myrsinacearum]RZS88607.1 AbrB family looped-hinge helix DNA binding protein [Phyllobacterium myrsinacearum]RZU97455.1 AbrB family looped-hinge helix DNA binding protein [Phyllobacterium myrsinacearum]